MNHVDYFKNPIEVGDIVLRNCNGTQYIAQVLRVTPKSIGLSRYAWQKHSRIWNKSTHNYEIKEIIETKPLFVQYFSGINLSKLDNSKIQETIKSFINEI